MNVVIVNDFAFVNGGAAQVALSSAQGLADRRHQVTVFSAVESAAEPLLAQPNLAVVNTGQLDIAHDTSRLRASVQGIWNVQARNAMRKLLDSLDPSDTVVHFHGWSKALSSSVIRETVSRRFRSVLTLHDYFSACPNGGFFNYRTQTRCSLRPMSAACLTSHCDPRSYPQKLWRVARQVVQQKAGKVPGHVRHFISVSDFSAAILKPYLPADAQMHAIPNPIDMPQAPRAETRASAGFVYVGRLSPEKGSVLLARASRALDVPMTFVGEGPTREAIEQANPAAQVTGWQPRQGVRERIRGALALVLPSLCWEPQGLVVGEAAALGVCAIVPDQCAAADAVIEGVTGLVFRSGDESDLRRKLLMLQEQPALASAMGAAAFERYWADPPTLQRHVQSLEAVYDQILAEPEPLTLERAT
jgi:glycosyltransferase involved in cell wall biosynthesis